MFQKLYEALGPLTEQGYVATFTGPLHFLPFSLRKRLKCVLCISIRIHIIQTRFILYSVLLLNAKKKKNK